ncbi:MAG: right-handed parallel beta-helix repeat-containing protein [Candidatus Limnocylindrales bacterium]
MHRSLRALLVSGALVGSLVASLPASVSAASVTTRWVDADGRVGRTGCDGTSRSAHRTIQQGVDAANAADVVKVCPGSYVGRVVISGARDGLVLQAAVYDRRPVLEARDAFGASPRHLITIDSVSKVTVRTLRIRPSLATSHASCSPSTGIRAIDATRVVIAYNDIRPAGSGAFCGVHDGITASRGTTGIITHNVIRDFRDNGIDISGASTDVIVESNRVTLSDEGAGNAGGAAIVARAGASVILRHNSLRAPAPTPGDPLPPAGIELDTHGEPSSVHGNDIYRYASAIKVTRANGATIRDNTMSGGQVGLNLLDADGADVSANTSTGATVHALFVAGGGDGSSDASKTTGAQIYDNDLRSDANGANPDCLGDSDPAGYVAAMNHFAGNEVTTSSPAEMCGGVAPV